MTHSRTCPFCAVIADDASDGVDFRSSDVVAFLDARPLFPGHLLVVPTQHIQTLGELPEALLVPLMRVVQAASRAMESGIGAQGSFIAINNRVSQSVPHMHVHVVPRTKGDGLKGFFWPRKNYRDQAERDEYIERLQEAIERELNALG